MSERASKVYEGFVGKAQGILDLVDYASDSVVSKTLMDKQAGTITLFAFDKGQGLSEHTSPYDAVVQVVEGVASLTIGGRGVEVREGQIVAMPAHVPHAVAAPERFKMLLTLIRG
ncbi:MAG: cupin domain-containing protein [Phycisphaerae bacterium]|nr:cupin domain-containing protein [Phycisphaerae bacterium]